jgi:hypothetical protein
LLRVERSHCGLGLRNRTYRKKQTKMPYTNVSKRANALNWRIQVNSGTHIREWPITKESITPRITRPLGSIPHIEARD